ncbi:hypothetical protein J7L70_09230 [Candidatus Bathyarchaeota archaeon]|nr:hypothetical protein [Candidatus Bathyarchaeota archaeon]
MGEEKEKRREMEDIEELRAVLKVVREEVPPLMRGIVDPLKEILGITLTEEQARQRARAIAVMYKELVNAGMPPQDAMRIVETQTVNLTALVRDLLQGVFGESMAKRGRREEEREISREVKEQVKKAIEGKLEETEE